MTKNFYENSAKMAKLSAKMAEDFEKAAHASQRNIKKLFKLEQDNEIVAADFYGKMGTDKTLIIDLLEKTLGDHGVMLKRHGQEGHSVAVFLNDEQRSSIAKAVGK